MHQVRTKMDCEAVNLCIFCSDLVEFREKCSDANRLVSHHPTTDLLTTSSSTCRLCRVIAKPWTSSPLGGKSTTESSSPWSVEVRILESRQMPSGVFWIHSKVYFQPDKGYHILSGVLSFITCRAGGKYLDVLKLFDAIC